MTKYEMKCAEGKHAADALIDRMRDTNNPTLLGVIVREIDLTESFAVGFLNRVAEKLIQS